MDHVRSLSCVASVTLGAAREGVNRQISVKCAKKGKNLFDYFKIADPMGIFGTFSEVVRFRMKSMRNFEIDLRRVIEYKPNSSV